MPLSRHKVANEYSLGGRDLYKKADQHDPEAVLDGVATAGLVGVLRQLGDLAGFAAQVFHGLYDEVMIASARGHGLLLRVQQLETELPLMEKDSCQRDYLYVASNRGVDWHANPRVDHGVVTRGDTPRFIMESIKQCHGPPKLFMLDKYDIGGEGACLKRYTDPSFFKTDSACSSILQEGIQRERRPIRAMEIRLNLQNSEIFRPPNESNNDSKLEADLSGDALDEVPTRRQRLKYRQLNGSVFQSFRPQMQNLYEKVSSEEKPSMDQSEVQISFTDSPDSNTEERDIMVDTFSSMDKGKEDHCTMVRKNRSVSEEALSRSSDARSVGSRKGYNSEVDIYVDALTTMDYEVKTDSEHRDHEHRAFARVESDKICSDTQNAVASRSSNFSKKDSLVPYSSDIGSENRDKADHHQDDVTVSIPQAKPVAGEHERSSSLEELFVQEKPVFCEHERTKSLEELLTGDVHASEPDMRAPATESNTNGIVSNATSDGTVDSTKKAKENPNIATISLKKKASKRSKYVGGMELLASKVSILPRKLSKKHDPFSNSLRNMAKELLELKYDGTQDTGLYDFEANGEGCDVKCLEMPHPPVEIKEEIVMHNIPSDSPQDDVGSRECQPAEVNQESDHDVPPTDSPQDPVPDGNGFQHANIVYLRDITSQSPQEEEGCAGAATDKHSSTGMLDHMSELMQEQIKDILTEVVSENTSDMGEELKEVRICEEQVNVQDVEGCSESDEYAVDDESTEYIEEQVVSDGVIASPTSSKQSDDPCRITPLIFTDADDAIASKGMNNYIPEMEYITLSETITKADLPKLVTESVITNEVAMPDDEQCCLHPEPSFAQDTALSSCEVVGQNEQLPLCSSSMMAATPDHTVNTGGIHDLCRPMHQEPPNLCNISSTENCGAPLAPDSRDVPLPNISSFDWMLDGAMQQSLNVLPTQPTYGILQENGSSEDIEDAPPLPPLPPIQWRTARLQTGPTTLFAKLGRPLRPKPPVKHQESESNSSLDERSQEDEMLQERTLHNGFTSQKEMAQVTVSNEIQTNPFLNRDSQENHLQEGYEECDVQASNIFSASEVKTTADVTSVEGDNLHTLQLPELMVIPEEAWSELVDIKPIPAQAKERKHELSNVFSDCNGMLTTVLPTEKTNEENERSDKKEKEIPAADINTVADSEENKTNGVTSQDDTQNPDLSVQHEDVECGSSDDKAMEFSSAVEEELAKLPPYPVTKPPRYPLLQVTSHDRSVLRKAPTLVQPLSKLSDEKNTILEQIKNKSFNLKPVLAKRPNVMGGPRMNLQAVAILERVNAIRQAVADDDNEDSWSE